MLRLADDKKINDNRDLKFSFLIIITRRSAILNHFNFFRAIYRHLKKKIIVKCL